MSHGGGSGDGLRVDVFCRVVDNFGDAAVAWRLACALASEQGFDVRLFIDQAAVLAKLVPAVNASGASGRVDGVEIGAIDAPHARPPTLGDVVLETFGCGLPAFALDMLADSQKAWINLEYLSAEPWVDGFHGLSSPQRDHLPDRHFFFPGFTAKTGGLLREAGLLQQRDAFLRNDEAKDAFWLSLGVLPRIEGEVRISLFAYAANWDDDWLISLAKVAALPLHLIVADGVMRDAVVKFCGRGDAGDSATVGHVTVSVMPFLSQSDFDRLLWACDLNVVRGEDSFVRAQLSGNPMLWDIYPQSEDAHLKKLDAFLDRYCAGWPDQLMRIQREASHSLVGRSDSWTEMLLAWCAWRQELTLVTGEWAKELEMLPELGFSVGQFARKLLECRPS